MDRIALSRLGGLGLLGLVAAGAGACVPQSGASFSPTTGVLSIRGTASGDVYVVSVAAGAIVVNGGQVPIRGGVPTVANTLRIEMRGAEGVDLLELDESGGPLPDARVVGGPGSDVLVGGSGDDTIEGGTGDDLVLLGPGADTAVWRAGDGLDTVEGEEDADTLRVEGADVDERVDVVAVSGRVHFVRDVDAVTLDVAGIETVHFLARGGADTIVLGDVSGTGMALLDVDLAASVGGPDGFADAITWSGTNGADAIALSSDAASAQLDAAAQAGLRVTAQEAADRLTLNALGGDDAVDGTSADLGLALVANLGLGVDTYLGTDGAETVTGGDGNDHVLLGGGDDEFVWNPGDDSDIVEGEAGWDRLRFNGANVGESIDFAAFGGRISLSRNVALVALDLGTLEAISLRMLGGTDLVAVGDLSGTGLTELDVDLASAAGVGDAMADAVIAFGTPGADVVALGGDASSVEVLGLPTSITLANTDGPLDSLSLQTLGGEDSVHAGDLLATAPKLTVEGGAQDDVLVGGDGDDSLLGDDGDDVLIGGPGVDLLDGGAGSNIVIQ